MPTQSQLQAVVADTASRHALSEGSNLPRLFLFPHPHWEELLLFAASDFWDLRQQLQHWASSGLSRALGHIQALPDPSLLFQTPKSLFPQRILSRIHAEGESPVQNPQVKAKTQIKNFKLFTEEDNLCVKFLGLFQGVIPVFLGMAEGIPWRHQAAQGYS